MLREKRLSVSVSAEISEWVMILDILIPPKSISWMDKNELPLSVDCVKKFTLNQDRILSSTL